MTDLQLGIVGLGNWGKNVARCFSRTDGARLALLCEGDAQRLAAQQALYPEARATQQIEDVLADPTLDAIALVTPAPTHYALGKRVLEANKHLYVEKPLTLSSADAASLCAIARERQRVLMVGHLLEYHPAVLWMKDYVDSGALGDILYMYSHRLNLGIVRPDENAFWSLAPHDVSVILYLFGSQPDWVAAHGASYLQPGVEDVVFATLHFPDGRMAQVHVSWLDPTKERRMVLVGARTMVVFDDMTPAEPVKVFDKGAVKRADAPVFTVRQGENFVPPIAPAEPLQTECQHFVDAIRHGTAPRSDGADGLRVVRVLEAVEASLRAHGQQIEVKTA